MKNLSSSVGRLPMIVRHLVLSIALCGPAVLCAEALSPLASGNSAAINTAIDKAGAGGVVELGEGTFEIEGTINVHGGVTLKGQGWDKTIIKPAEGKTMRCAKVGLNKDDGGNRLEGVTLTGANTTSDGAGVKIYNGTVSWCRIVGNATTGGGTSGGGVTFSSGLGTIDHCIVTGNTITSGSWGAGIGGLTPAGPVLVDTCLVYGNEDKSGSGGGIGFQKAGSVITVRNTTVTGNKCSNGNGHGLYFNDCFSSASLVLVNTILSGNISGTTECNCFIAKANFDGKNSSNCLITGTQQQYNGNIFKDAGIRGLFENAVIADGPQFADAANLDFRLTAESPARAKGLAYAGIGADLDNVAFSTVRPSIGCYEYIAAGKVDDPVFEPESGLEFYPTLPVALSCLMDGAEIRYTLDGTEPDESSALYTAPIELTATTTVTARGFKAGNEASEIMSATYTLIEPLAPTLGDISVVPLAGKALLTGSVTSVGNNGATACEVSLTLGEGEPVVIASGVTGAFRHLLQDLELGTTYDYTLSVVNDARYVMRAEANGSFTTLAERAPLTPTGADDTEIVLGEIEAAAPGETVEFGEGTFLISSTLVLDKAIVVKGAGAGQTVLDFQQRCRGVQMTSAEAVLEGVTVKQGLINANGGGVNMTAGTLRACRITACEVTENSHSGGGIYMTGGTVEACEIDNCKFNNLYGYANALFMNGGLVTGCDIHNNDGGYNNKSYGCSVVELQNGTLASSKIHDNNKKTVPGVRQQGGKLINCLVYNNVGELNENYGSAGIFKDGNNGGETYNCTVFNCVLTGDMFGYSGLNQQNGTTKNCIVWACHPETSTAGSVAIRNGTFANGLTEVAGDTGALTSDPMFIDTDQADFRIVRASPAYRAGVPVEGVEVDFAGIARDVEAPCIGAYEYDPSTAEFDLKLRLAATRYALGDEIAVQAIVIGADDAETSLPIVWTLDGAELGSTAEEVSLTDIAAGNHVLGASVAYLGRTATDEVTFSVLPLRVYVNETGSGTYPYATEETATDSLEVALASLYSDADRAGEIVIGEGTYTVEVPVVLSNPVSIRGAGAEETTVTFAGGVVTAFTLSHPAAKLLDLTVTGNVQGALMSAGEIRGCRFVECRYWIHEQNTMGAGVALSGGLVADCLFQGCVAQGVYGRGGAVYVTGGTVTGCTMRACEAGATMESAFGGSVCVIGKGLVTNCRIEGAKGKIFPAFCVTGEGVIRNTYVTGTEAGASAMATSSGTVENCTIAGNTVAEGQSAVIATAGTFVNTIVWNNVGGAANQLAVAEYCCYPEAEPGEDGNTSADPQLREDGRLRASSPCRNHGVNRDWMTGALDLNGNPRLVGKTVDMGAFELPPVGLVMVVK